VRGADLRGVTLPEPLAAALIVDGNTRR